MEAGPWQSWRSYDYTTRLRRAGQYRGTDGCPYISRAVSTVNAYGENLWAHLDRTSALTPDQRRELLRFFLSSTCEAQNVTNIEIGHYGISTMPRDWVAANIETEAEPILHAADSDWEWRRLMELYEELDHGLLRRLAIRAARHEAPWVREAGEDFVAWLEKHTEPLPPCAAGGEV